jgi:hypothetical protein
LAAFANANGISLQQAIGSVFDKYQIRDSAAWKAKG